MNVGAFMKYDENFTASIVADVTMSFKSGRSVAYIQHFMNDCAVPVIDMAYQLTAFFNRPNKTSV